MSEGVRCVLQVLVLIQVVVGAKCNYGATEACREDRRTGHMTLYYHILSRAEDYSQDIC